MPKHEVAKYPSLFNDDKAKSDYKATCRGKASSDERGFHFEGTTKPNRSEVHHILPVATIQARRRFFDEKGLNATFLNDLMTNVKWDINGEKNLIEMPTNEQFRRGYDSLPEGDWKPTGLPSHNCDHTGEDGYFREVLEHLEQQVWSTLESKKPSHEVDVANVQKALEDAVTHFRDALKMRGTTKWGLGQKEGWKNRFESSYKDRWYKPFSMCKKPSERSPGRAGEDPVLAKKL